MWREARSLALAVASALGLISAAATLIPGFPLRAQTVSPGSPPVAVAPAARRLACVIPPEDARFQSPLARVARHLRSDLPVKVVAVGSSSTAGAGASSPDASYPGQLAANLSQRFQGHQITVLNRGVNGDDASGMLARFQDSVIAEDPDLVIWQVGTNSVLRDHPIDEDATRLHQGLLRLKAIRADVVLIDPQFAPKVIAKPNAERMVEQIATTAKAENVDLFRRFDLMRHWYEVEHLGFDDFLSPDGLHMNDWSYACLAKGLGNGIAQAAARPTTTAADPP